ncbi:MAG TPA: aspartate-semialdehyde dehydrogenase [Thermoanaerobaculia bacterium]|nr:aspartate-semialdehyde dehydrogenase [Thermoanaerobaculia bacterium]
MKTKIPVGVLGATGTVGQRFVERLATHPWFELVAVAASERSEGRPYAEATRWRLTSPLPERIAAMAVRNVADELPCRAVFSALDAGVAREVEPLFARRGAFVFSNASAHRMDDDVPLVIPEINPDSLCILERQRANRGWTGSLVTNANCSAMFLTMALAPLDRAFGAEKAFVSTMQAVSGAGYPGVPSLDILGNVLPDIPGEAEKIEREVAKILGGAARGDGAPARLTISAATYRVPVEDGHTEAVSVGLVRKASAQEVESAWEEFRGRDDVRDLPSAPENPIVYVREPHRPQPRRDSDTGDGMSTTIGGLRPCRLLDWKFTALGHNTIRGAAGASILNAELAVARGLLL